MMQARLAVRGRWAVMKPEERAAWIAVQGLTDHSETPPSVQDPFLSGRQSRLLIRCLEHRFHSPGGVSG
jgi:hypothetical protein